MKTEKRFNSYGGKRVRWLKGGDVIHAGDVEWQCNVSITYASVSSPTEVKMERGRHLLKAAIWRFEPVAPWLIGRTVKSTEEGIKAARMIARPRASNLHS